MSILETLNDTIGNIVYGLKNRFDRPYIFSKRRVFRGQDHRIRFAI
jgi:hypothetical protein